MNLLPSYGQKAGLPKSPSVSSVTPRRLLFLDLIVLFFDLFIVVWSGQ